MAHYGTILFDLDHTLMDSDASERAAFAATMTSIGIADADPHFPTYTRINKMLWAAVERGDLTPDEVAVARFAQLIHAASFDGDDPRVDAESMAHTFRTGLGANGDLYPGVRSVLETLASRATLAVITNGIGSVQRARIERLGLLDFFDRAIISGEVGVAKPNAEIFSIAFEQLGHPPLDSCVIVGDSLSSDIRGGTNAGIATAWYNPHNHTPGPHDRITHTFANLRQLPDLV